MNAEMYDIAISFLFGAVIGSFLNVLIVRLPETEAAGIGGYKSLLYLAYPGSRCPKCKAAITWHFNIPIIGFFLAGGKCSNCRKKIAWHYPLIELALAIGFAASIAVYGITIAGFAACLFVFLALGMSVIDIQRYYLLDILVFPMLWFGLLININGLFANLSSAVLGVIFGYLILWLVAFIGRKIFRRDAMGMGDAKLLAALGAWFGWQAIPGLIFLSAGFGLLTSVIFMFWGSKSSRVIPFGPALCAAALLLLWSSDSGVWLIY